MDVSRKARFGGVKFQRASSLTYGLLLQAFHPAGPDGIRGRGSCLQIGLDAPFPYRIAPYLFRPPTQLHRARTELRLD